MELNPQYETCGIKVNLTTICHDAGMKARFAGQDYYAAYYSVLAEFMPNHPALHQAA